VGLPRPWRNSIAALIFPNGCRGLDTIVQSLKLPEVVSKA
jgi:hypothetical protein